MLPGVVVSRVLKVLGKKKKGGDILIIVSEDRFKKKVKNTVIKKF